jgi:hypothetical protein
MGDWFGTGRVAEQFKVLVEAYTASFDQQPPAL